MTNPDLLKSLVAVVKYLEAEKKDFEALSEDERGGHIYPHVTALKAYLRQRKGKLFLCPRCKQGDFLLLIALSDVTFTKDGLGFTAKAFDYETNRDGMKCDACDYGSEEADELRVFEGFWEIEARRVS